jgi:hypothetical protein
VRVEVADNCPQHLVDYLLKQFGLSFFDRSISLQVVPP